MIMKFLLAALALLVGSCSAQPSKNEFDLFCKILGEANGILYGADYVYDEDKDKEVLKEMEVLYNATTDNMNQFRKTLWVTKDFFEDHPPPTDPENRRKAHREIGNLIDKGEKIIQDSREIAEQINQKMKEAKLPVAQGLYGENVTEIPKDEGNWTAVKDNTKNIFVDENTVANSCGNGGKDKAAGKTFINDLFCVCVGGEATNAEGPCHPKIWPPKSWNDNGGQGNWKQIKYGSGTLTVIPSFNESFQKIEQVCREEMTEKNVKSEKIPALLDEYVGLIGKGDEQVKKNNGKMIFGHSWRRKNRKEVTKCDGTQGGSNGNGNDKNNEKICVDYTHNLHGTTYDIPWHKKFKEASEKMDQTKDLEEKILKNRAALLLLKSEAWVAYSREKDDETSNLDDMNVSHLFDGSYPVKTNTMAEKKAETREYIDVSQETTEPSQPSQPVQGQGAPGNPPHYILISSTETSQPSPKKTDEGKGGGRDEPEVTVISSESTTQEAASPSQGPSQATSQPPTQSAKRLREEKKTGE